jgi:hypothetical protein
VSSSEKEYNNIIFYWILGVLFFEYKRTLSNRVKTFLKKTEWLSVSPQTNYCKSRNFCERFIFTNALSNANLKHAKISTIMHQPLNFCSKRRILSTPKHQAVMTWLKQITLQCDIIQKPCC